LNVEKEATNTESVDIIGTHYESPVGEPPAKSPRFVTISSLPSL
jgi:hypothetical protein